MVKTTTVELGALAPIMEKLPYIRETKVYQQHSKALTNFLLSLHKLRGNKVPRDEVEWKAQYIKMSYNMVTRDLIYTFEITSANDRIMSDNVNKMMGD